VYKGEYDLNVPLTDKEKRKLQRRKDKERQEKFDKKKKKQLGIEGIEQQAEIEFVPKKMFEDYDEDDLAETLALAKRMIRKKERDLILDESINRYNYMDAAEDLPNWFTEDEKKHMYLAAPVTKDEIQVEKERIREWKDRPSKKVVEAKFRKKKRQMAELKRFKNKADDIFEQEGIDERSKVRQVGKAFAHAQRKIHKTKTKKVIVGKKSSAQGGGATQGRKFRMVDSRGKKDLRAEKRAERKKKGNYNPNATKKKYRRR